MFSECEKWRIDFEVEHLKHTFVFEEREKVNQYYPQYYHKTDNVYTLRSLFISLHPPCLLLSFTLYSSTFSSCLCLYPYLHDFDDLPRCLTIPFLGISMLTGMIVGSTIIFRTIRYYRYPCNVQDHNPKKIIAKSCCRIRKVR